MTATLNRQRYILSNLGVVKGMLNEIEARRNRLRSKLQGNPNIAGELQKELGCLEGEMNAVLFTLDFIEGLPTQ